MQIIPCLQYQPGWWRARQGVPTASNAKKIVTAVKGDLSDTAVDYACCLIADRLTPGDYWLNQVDPKSQSMAHGSFRECEARNYMAMLRDCEIEEVGFVTNDAGTVGCSPDGFFPGRTCGLEVKCPELRTHVRYLIDDVLPKEHKQQVHASMAITGCREWVLLSYVNHVDPFIVLTEWDSYTDRVAEALEKFVEMYDGMWQRIEAKLKQPAHWESPF